MTRKPAKPKAEIPLEDMTRAQLADAYGPLLEAFKPLEKRVGAFKAEFERRELTLLKGEAWAVHLGERSWPGIDIVAAKAKLGAEWCKAHTKMVSQKVWTATRLKDGDREAPGEDGKATA